MEDIEIISRKWPNGSSVNPLLVFRSDNLQFAINTDTVEDGEEIQIMYKILNTQTVAENAWFGAFPRSASKEEWRIWKYIQGTAGIMTLIINTDGERGPWQIRFFKDVNASFVIGKLDFHVRGESYCPVRLTLNKYVAYPSDVINVTYDIDADLFSKFDQTDMHIHITEETTVRTPKIGIFVKSAPSTRPSSIIANVLYTSDTVPIQLHTDGGIGDFEVRFFVDTHSYQPLLRVPMQIVPLVDNFVLRSCAWILDGGTLHIDYDFSRVRDLKNGTSDGYIGVYYSKDLTHEIDNSRIELKSKKGSVDIVVESGTRPTGKWEIRLFSSYDPRAVKVAPFYVMGATEVFSDKLRKCLKFADTKFTFH
jgi:hypothetical protein